MKNLLTRLWQDEGGQDLVEYALLMALIALAALSTMSTVASAVINVFSNASANLTTS